MRTFLSFRHTPVTLIRLLLAGLLLTTWAGLPRSGYSAPAAAVWYVAPGGTDPNNSCTTAANPCEHIQAAIDKSTSGGTIHIAAGTYIEQLTIRDRNLTLIGQSAANTFLDGDQRYQILAIYRESTPQMTISLSGVTLQNGSSTQPGGAINNDRAYLTISNSNIISSTSSIGGGIINNGILKLINVTVSSNSATGSEGGGIYNSGSLELNGVLLTNNKAPSGGGISNQNTVTITASSIVSNTSNGGIEGGGGIYNHGGESSKITLLNSTLSGNEAVPNYGGAIFNKGILTGTGNIIWGNRTAQAGGGVYNDTSGEVILNAGSIRNNTADNEGGGLFNGGIAQLDGALITGNKAVTTGGGIHNAANGRLTLGTTTVITNTALGALGGGGINNLGTLTVTQSALVNNTSTNSQGGGLNNASAARLTNVTIGDNTALSGGGIQNSGGRLSLQFSTIGDNSSPALNNASGTVTVTNSILAQSTGSACGGTIVSAGYNVDTGISCGFNAAGDASSVTSQQLQLGPLRDNGGGTLTRAIDFSSLAVDSAGACPSPAVDQRGVSRPQPPSPPPPQPASKCDRGAYEVVGYTNSNALDIGPGQCGNRTLTINEKFAIGRMLAGVNLTSTNRSDLTVRLLSPGLSRVTLLGPAANSGANLDVMFDDSKSQVVPGGPQDTGAPYFYPSYKPATPLSQVRGTGIQGTWKLEICNAGTAKATLNRWVLVVPEFGNFRVYMPVTRRS